MKKKISLLLSVALAASIFVGCAGKKPEVKRAKHKEENKQVQNVKVCFPDGIPALTIAKLAKENIDIDKSVKLSYEVEKTPDALISKVLKGEADIAVVPSNLAAQAYNKKLPYRLAANSGWGSFFLVGTEEIKSFDQLKGKEIYNIGKGLTPDIVFKYILSKNNVDIEKDVKFSYLNSATELAPAFISGKSKIAVIPEPMLSKVLMKKGDTKICFDINKEWKKCTGSVNGYPQSSLIIKKDIIDNNSKFVEKFLKDYKESIAWANENPQKLGEYAKDLGLSVNKEAVVKALPRANMGYADMNDCKKDYENYYKVLLQFSPKSIGGKLPDEGLYIQK